MEANEVKNLFERVLSNNNMQAVVTCCVNLPIVEVEKESCRQAFHELTALQRRVLKRRVSAYSDALAAQKAPEARQQFQMLTQIKKIIM